MISRCWTFGYFPLSSLDFPLIFLSFTAKPTRMKSSTFLKIAIGFQLITAFVHSLSFLNTPVGTNDQENMMIDLMTNYMMDMGAGYHRSMFQILNALSACFSLLYLFGGVVNWYLLRQKVDSNILKGVLTINIAIFGFNFALDVILTFLPPIIMTGLTFLFLCLAMMTLRKVAER